MFKIIFIQVSERKLAKMYDKVQQMERHFTLKVAPNASQRHKYELNFKPLNIQLSIGERKETGKDVRRGAADGATIHTQSGQDRLHRWARLH
jgi:hypothetical protein